jgi:hypothetical protein
MRAGKNSGNSGCALLFTRKPINHFHEIMIREGNFLFTIKGAQKRMEKKIA